MAQGKNNRKHGRSSRKHADQRYLNEMRWIKNKKLAIARHTKRMAKKEQHKIEWRQRHA